MNLWDWKVTAPLGAALWGGWSLVVNWEAGVGSAAISAAAQALVSLGSISLLTLLANRVLAQQWPNPVIQVVAGTVLPYGALLTLVVAAHRLVHTHDMVRTIAPSASIGIAFSAVYAFKNRGTGAPAARPPELSAQLSGSGVPTPES